MRKICAMIASDSPDPNRAFAESGLAAWSDPDRVSRRDGQGTQRCKNERAGSEPQRKDGLPPEGVAYERAEYGRRGELRQH